MLFAEGRVALEGARIGCGLSDPHYDTRCLAPPLPTELTIFQDIKCLGDCASSGPTLRLLCKMMRQIADSLGPFTRQWILPLGGIPGHPIAPVYPSGKCPPKF